MNVKAITNPILHEAVNEPRFQTLNDDILKNYRLEIIWQWSQMSDYKPTHTTKGEVYPDMPRMCHSLMKTNWDRKGNVF